MLIVTECGMPYQVEVSSMIVFFRIGSFTLLTQSQFVTGSWTTSPVSQNPGLVVRPLLTNTSLLGSTYGGSRPVTRSVKSVTTTRAPTTSKPIFSAFTIFALRTFVSPATDSARDGSPGWDPPSDRAHSEYQ